METNKMRFIKTQKKRNLIARLVKYHNDLKWLLEIIYDIKQAEKELKNIDNEMFKDLFEETNETLEN